MNTALNNGVLPADAKTNDLPDVEQYVEDYLAQVRDLLSAMDPAAVAGVVDILSDACSEGRRLVLCGNGGSAATASHLVCDFQKNVLLEGGCAWEVIALTDSPSLITAWSNDTEYANVFAGQARTWLRRNDVLIAISGSGNSPNVLRAVEVGNEVGATTIGWSGYSGGKLAQTAKINIVVPSDNMQRIEDVHMMLGHIVFSAVRDRLKGLVA